VTLKFWRWLGVEQPAYDHAYVRVSNNGSSWTTIWENNVETTDSSWGLQEYDISSVADGESTVYIRWTMGTTDSSWQYCGWNIDDVEIWALVPSSPGAIIGAGSCLSHGVAGDLCIDLDAVGIEPRQPGVQSVEFDVSQPATTVSATVSCTPDGYGGTATVDADGSTVVTANFDPALPDQNCCEISLSGDVAGTYAVQTLAGDVNLDGSVTTADALQIKVYFGQGADAANCEFDFNCSGDISTADSLQIKLSFGNEAAACP
jgi:hypothetical protein